MQSEYQDPDPTNVLEPFVCITGNEGTTVTVEGPGLGFAETHTINASGYQTTFEAKRDGL